MIIYFQFKDVLIEGSTTIRSIVFTLANVHETTSESWTLGTNIFCNTESTLSEIRKCLMMFISFKHFAFFCYNTRNDASLCMHSDQRLSFHYLLYFLRVTILYQSTISNFSLSSSLNQNDSWGCGFDGDC